MNQLPARRAICVLGMHRSGTSAITRILNLLGVELGTHLLPPAADNPEGFWENLFFVLLNENIFTALGAAWDNVTPTFNYPNLGENPDLTAFPDQIKGVILANFFATPLWGWKDPRTCLLFPLWSEVLDSFGIRTDVVVAWRNPVSVANSLSLRNGFPAEKSYRLWYIYMLSALYHTCAKRRILVNYDKLMDDWSKETERLASELELPRPGNKAEFNAAVATFLKPDLRHSRYSYEQTIEELPSYAAELFALLVSRDQYGEKEFNRRIHLLYSFYASLERSNILLAEKSFRDINQVKLTLYYSDNEEFREERSLSAPVELLTDQNLKFALTTQGVLFLRIDPLNWPGLIDNLQITITSGEGELLFSTGLPDFNGIGQPGFIDCRKIEGQNTATLLTTSHDPQIKLPGIMISSYCHINISLRVSGLIPLETARTLSRIIQENEIFKLNLNLV